MDITLSIRRHGQRGVRDSAQALLHLAARWRDSGGPQIHAATGDHDLRPGSRAEAEAVAQWANALQIPHTILTWTGERPRARVQELARAARYRLLEDLATRIGAEVLLTGHHADEQAETILFRLLRGSGVAGLAALAPVPARPTPPPPVVKFPPTPWAQAER